MRTHYDNLYVGEKATPEVIKAAYKALAQKWHPDKNPDQRAKAERYFRIINRAFEVLSDPEKRAAYDLWLSRERGESGVSDPESGHPSSGGETDSGGSRSPRWHEVEEIQKPRVSAAMRTPHEIPERSGKRLKDSDIWFLRLWTYLILPLPSLLIVAAVLLNSTTPGASIFNIQQIAFLTFSGFLVLGLHERLLLAWRLNWVALPAAPALVWHIAGYSGLAGAACGVWTWWSVCAWLRIKPSFMTISDWCQLQEQVVALQEKPERMMHKPLKGKIWGGWKAFFYSYLFFIPVFLSGDEFDFLGALLLSFFIAAFIGAFFAFLSDLEVTK